MEHYAKTRWYIRQAAAEGRLRIRGRHEIEVAGQGRTNFSEIYTEIPSAYWKHSVINVFATGAAFEADRHTDPEKTPYAWGPKGLYEPNCYTGLQLNSDDVSQLIGDTKPTPVLENVASIPSKLWNWLQERTHFLRRKHAAMPQFPKPASILNRLWRDPVWSKVIATGITAGFGGLVFYFLHTQNPPQPPAQPAVLGPQRGGDIASSSTPPLRGPTLEATNKSKIDATGGEIPGDLPFQFGRAENNSLIDMPGIKVTKTGKGYTVTPGNVSRQFPAPTGEFAIMSMPELKHRIEITAEDLRQFQDEFNREFFEPNRKWPSEERAKPLLAKFGALYDQRFASITFSLASAALNKIGTIDGSDMSLEARDGGNIVYDGKFVGPDAAKRAAAFLEVLDSKLPQ